MIVCSCFGVTDRELRGVERSGNCRAARAGTGCGNCRRLVDAILAKCEDHDSKRFALRASGRAEQRTA